MFGDCVIVVYWCIDWLDQYVFVYVEDFVQQFGLEFVYYCYDNDQCGDIQYDFGKGEIGDY